MPSPKPVLVTGATGYVGGRLIPRLTAAGFTVRAMGRSMEKLSCRPWAGDPLVELVQGDARNPDALKGALQGCDSAYYLIHAMLAQKERFADADRTSARNMAAAAEACGLSQIIYLGGLGEMNHPHLSRHLASRHEVGEILKAGRVPTTVLRAAMIIGSGSASFEILRYLVDRLPLMMTPRWVQSPTQPIAIGNVLDYLVGCLQTEAAKGKTFDIGGPDVLSYQDLIHMYAREAKLPRRRIIPLPVLTPRLSARWIHLVTPVPAAIAMPLTEGLSVPTTCRTKEIQSLIPLKLTTCRQAIRLALDRILEKQVETCWSDAGALQPPEWAVCGDAGFAGGTVLTCSYRLRLELEAETIWPVVASIGGDNGYYFGNWLWKLRGAMDRLMGGVGLRRGRRHPHQIQVGDALDFWRVLDMAPSRRLTLLAEMKVPGEAVLDIQIHPLDTQKCELRLMSRFLPRGLFGLVYWYSLYPVHILIFKGMLQGMAETLGIRGIVSPRPFHPHTDPSCSLSVKQHRYPEKE